jgi:hypothetical protein
MAMEYSRISFSLLSLGGRLSHDAASQKTQLGAAGRIKGKVAETQLRQRGFARPIPTSIVAAIDRFPATARHHNSVNCTTGCEQYLVHNSNR